ncbi:MAG TPA: response regulator transcription factor [Chloroflexota bacterium]
MASQSSATVLLAEDDLALATMTIDGLEQAGYRVWHARNAAEAELLADEARPDLVVLDLILPDGSGLLLCVNLKARLGVPVIICSASRREEDAVLSLKLGAEDFVRKPFHLPELLARIETALRRAAPRGYPGGPAGGSPPRQQRIGELVVDPARREARIGDRRLPLTPTEYRLLCALASRPDEVVARDELARLIWGQHDAAIDEALAVHMRRLRAKLDLEVPSGPVLTTMRGFGYRLSDRGRRGASAGELAS